MWTDRRVRRVNQKVYHRKKSVEKRKKRSERIFFYIFGKQKKNQFTSHHQLPTEQQFILFFPFSYKSLLDFVIFLFCFSHFVNFLYIVCFTYFFFFCFARSVDYNKRCLCIIPIV